MSEVLYSRCCCNHCEGPIEFPLEASGSDVDCPHCGKATHLMAESPSPAPEETGFPGELTPGKIAAAFTGRILKPSVSILYQVGLVIVTFTMIVLPLIYFALIAAAGWTVYWWATHGTFLLSGGGGARVWVLKLILYLAPLFAGSVVVFFMFKPLLARRAPAAKPLALNPNAEPVLFALVQCVCDTVGAPFPKRIDVDCNLNASAGFRRGLFSFLGNDLVLTIGMPLVAGMSLRQLTGVLAHEFGHFTQGSGMRLTYLIRNINGWFARIAYERDAWDLTLDEWAEGAEDWYTIIFVNFARLSVWFSRLILKLLLYTGHGIGCFMLRQMEYDADRYEIRLAGSEAFESTAKRLNVLGAALGNTYRHIQKEWKESQCLPENLPAALMRQEAALQHSAKTEIEDTVGLGKTGIFDSHPSDGDRIRQARIAGEPGIFKLDAPAKAIFSNFDVLAKQVTHLHYEDDLGIPLEKAKLSPVEGQV